MLKSTLTTSALPLAIVSAMLVLGAGLGRRTGLWSFQIGFILLAVGVLLGLLAFGIGMVALIRALPARRQGIPLPQLLTVLVAVAALGIPAAILVESLVGGYPPIHDITTDPERPPDFVAVLPLRGPDANSVDYSNKTVSSGGEAGRTFAEVQREYYPDILPVTLPHPPEVAFDRALESARRMGWEVVAAEPRDGRIEATATTFWFGFRDDVAVRLTPDQNGTRIDVRSTSRFGGGDLGTNADRIRAYLRELGEG